MINSNDTRQYTPKPQTVIIVYDQPKVFVVRRYTRTIIPRVNPDEYRRRFDHVLLDTATLLELTRRLNIQESMVKNLKIRNHFFVFSIDYTTKNKLNKSNKK